MAELGHVHDYANAATVTRFAPSPTGLLHVGHGYAAAFAHSAARAAGGRFLVRMEDLDTTRSRATYADMILEDLSWLGLDWAGPILHQSARGETYAAALARLRERGLVYPCFCTRREIRDEVARSASAPHGPDGPLYPGTCRGMPREEAEARIATGIAHAWRLDARRAAEAAGPLHFEEHGDGLTRVDPMLFGDLVLARKDAPAGYHLAVVVDDADQGVTLVTRGEDLRPATHVHRLLQALLDLPVPRWRHHRLVTDASGRRYAKRDRDVTIRALREAGYTPAAVLAMAEGRAPLPADQSKEKGKIP